MKYTCNVVVKYEALLAMLGDQRSVSELRHQQNSSENGMFTGEDVHATNMHNTFDKASSIYLSARVCTNVILYKQQGQPIEADTKPAPEELRLNPSPC